MSDPPPSKRARTDEHVIFDQNAQQQWLAQRLTHTLEDRAWVDRYREMLRVIPLETLYSIVTAAAAHDQRLDLSIQEAATDAHLATIAAMKAANDARIAAENAARAAAATQIINFDPLSKEVWHELNTRYSGLSGSKQYVRAYDALETVLDCISEIGNQTPVHASFGTKKSALETLRKIGKTICLSNTDVVGHEVINKMGWGETSLPDTMLSIVENMIDADRARFMTSEFEEKLVELEELAEDQCVFEGLGKVRFALTGTDEYSEEEDDDENDDQGDHGGEEDDEDEIEVVDLR